MGFSTRTFYLVAAHNLYLSPYLRMLCLSLSMTHHIASAGALDVPNSSAQCGWESDGFALAVQVIATSVAGPRTWQLLPGAEVLLNSGSICGRSS